MQNTVVIQDSEMKVREYNGRRVITFKDIDTVHERPDGTARKRFSSNRKHFIEGTDFFMITPKSVENTEKSVLRTLGISNVPNRGLTLITESGYLMIVKTFEDDLAWEVQRQLVNGYFKAKESYSEKPVNVDTFPEVRTRTPIIPTATPAPRNQNWFQKNNRRTSIICNKANVKRSTLYHHILLRVGEVFDIDKANAIYEEENGHQPEYAIDIVSYFKEMAEVADDYLDRIEEVIQREQAGGV